MSEAEGGYDVLPAREGYDRWSEIYDDEENPLIALEEPRVAALLGDVRDLDVVDVGCGTGRHALRLAALGARVTGLDQSEGMLERARAKPLAERVRWINHDVHAPLPLPSGAFDRVVCGLVLDHVRELEHALGEMRRVTRRDGRIVISVMHPALMLRGVQARFVDPETGREVRPESRPNTISDYVLAAARSGARIVDASEHAMDADTAARCPRGTKYLGWPMLFCLVLEA